MASGRGCWYIHKHQLNKTTPGLLETSRKWLLRSRGVDKPAGASAQRLSAPMIWVAEEGTRLPLTHTELPPLLHTFYSFSAFLPFDGLLCVQAVGKFSVMMRSSSTSNPPPPPLTPLRHTPPPFTLSLCDKSPFPYVQGPGPDWTHIQTCSSDLSRNLEELLRNKVPRTTLNTRAQHIAQLFRWGSATICSKQLLHYNYMVTRHWRQLVAASVMKWITFKGFSKCFRINLLASELKFYTPVSVLTFKPSIHSAAALYSLNSVKLCINAEIFIQSWGNESFTYLQYELCQLITAAYRRWMFLHVSVYCYTKYSRV